MANQSYYGSDVVIEGEVWKDVPGFEGYQVSDRGRVRSLKRLHPHVLHVGGGPDGYKMVNLRQDGRTVPRSVHRLVALAFLGPCPKDLEVCHTNGDRRDNRPENLRYDTPAGNQMDVTLARLAALGLTPDDIRHYRQLLSNSGLCVVRPVSRALGLSVAQTWAMAAGKLFPGLPGPRTSWREQARQRARELCFWTGRGRSYPEIAEMYDLDPSAVCQIVRRAGGTPSTCTGGGRPFSQPGDRSQSGQACNVLRELLQDGPRPVAELRLEARRRGVSWDVFRRAQALLGITTRQLDADTDGRRRAWSLPG